MLHKLLCFSVVPILVVVATKYYSLSYGQLLAEWLGGCRQKNSLEFQLTRCAHFANDRYLLLLLLTMTIISISQSSTPHQYNESPAAVVATCLLPSSSDKKLQLETQCPMSSSNTSCSNAAPQKISTASTTILVRPQLQQRCSVADQ
jgi:hypothetical protein